MKTVVLFDPEKKGPDRLITFRHDEPGPVPPIVNPPDPDEAKDAEPPKPDRPS